MFKNHCGTLLFLSLLALIFFGLPSSSMSQGVEAWSNLGLYGGQINDIAIDPVNPDKMFAGSYMGDGLFVTEDGGRSWQAVETENELEGEDAFDDHAVWAVQIAPGNNNVVWAAHNYWVEKSTDGGQTWTHIHNSIMQRDCPNCGGGGDNFRFCRSLAIDPTNHDLVYVGTGGPYGSSSSGAIYKTENGGTTWTKMNQGNDFDHSVVDIDIDPQNSNVIWAVTNSWGAGGWNGTLYRGEINGQGVDSWISVFSTPGGGFRDVEVKPNDSNSVFTGNDWGLFRHYFDGSQWQFEWILNYSTYPGWPPPPGEIWARWVWALAFDPQDPDVLYAAWKNPWASDTTPKVAKGTPPYVNRDTDWEIYTVDYHFLALTLHPENSEVIFGGESNLGVYKSQDHGQIWTSINNGINAVIVYDVVIDPNDSTHILAGTISGIYEKKGEGAWGRLLPYLTESLQFHPTDSLKFYAGLQGQLAKTIDGGLTWSYSDYLGLNIYDIAIDPSNTDTIFIAANGWVEKGEIHKSTDGGNSFRKVLEGVNQIGEKYDFNVVIFDPSDPNHIFAGGGNFYAPYVLGDLWESQDGGDSWTRTGLKNEIVNDVLIDPLNHDTMYAGCGYSGGTEVPVYKSMDGGDTWTASYEGIPGACTGLRGIWGTSPTDAFAVGIYGAFFTDTPIFHYNGSSWAKMDSGTTEDLHDIWGSSHNDVFAVGTSGTILHYDGNTWSSMSSGTTENLTDIWGSSGTDVFAVGDNGTILHYDGNAWTSVASGTTEDLYGVWGNSGSDVFTVGDNGAILHYDGNTWASMNSGTTELLESVWGSSGSDVFTVGDNGAILHYDGNTWASMNSGTTRWLNGVWGSSGMDVFAVGFSSIILHYDGSAWSQTDFGTTEHLQDVWGSSGMDVFVVGDLGGILHYDGSDWSVSRPPGSNDNAVTDLEFHRQDTNVVYAGTFGAGVYISPNHAGNWLNLGTPEHGVFAISTSSLYAATEGGLLQCSGTGLITGNITDATTGNPITSATIFNDLGGLSTLVINGQYMMISPSGICDITAIADGYANKTVVDVTAYGGDVTWVDIAMQSGISDPSFPITSGVSGTDGDYKCFIATAAYGSHIAQQVEILRTFRDQYLLPYPIGQKLVALYYSTGKPIAMYIESHPWLKFLVRGVLYPIVGLAWLLVSTSAMTKGFICLCISICVIWVVRRHIKMRSINKNSKLKYANNIMMVLIFTVLVLSGGRLHAATLFQQVGVSSSPNPVGSGARAVGMGGAFIAIADDATAASWNPAGLIQLETPEVSAVGAYFDRREDFFSDTHPEINNTAKTDDVNMNYFSGSYPFQFHRNMVVSINYQRLYEFERSFDYRYDYSSLGVNLLQDKHFSQTGHVGALGLAYAIEVTPKISFGITLNIWTDELLWQNGWEETFSERGVGTQGGVPVTIDTHITDRYSEFRGVNANFGVLWDMNKHLTLGAVIKTPFDASIRHEYSFKQTSTFGPPVSTTVTSQQSIAEYVELGMPMSYGIGLACRFSDEFTVDLDVYRTEWSEYTLTDSKGNQFSPIDGRPKSESNVKDTTQIRVGGEYLFISRKRNIVMPVRAGLFYDPEPAHGDVKDFYGVAVGSGIVYKRFVFDVAYQLRWGRDVDTGNLIATSKADVTQHLILASVIYHF